MEIFFGLLAAICFGLADFFARVTTHKVGVYRTLFYMHLVGFGGLTLLLLLSGGLAQLHLLERQAWFWETVAALISVFGYIALYRAFELGQLAIVSPISSAYAAVTVVLSAFAGERFTLIQLSGIGAILIGVILTTINIAPHEHIKPARTLHKVVQASRKGLPPGVGWAIAAALALGTTFWLLGFAVIPRLGSITPLWFFRLVAIAVMVPFIKLRRESLQPPPRKIGGLLIVMGLLDTGAFIAGNLGMALGAVAVVSTITSLYSTVTILLAWLFLHERLQWQQWGGILLIILGISFTQAR
ncbi:DMT family transporter [Tengunoibacter tsumagoiensis]|uniref:EamA domain-containing protein n=1 Tax=Tengunoibacter tsumagoiensis TaxID=2014871 RepID=A0A402A6Z8_9CHLR|nr:DMT family transporter [Tengunoibacter tsumagoiensis]GCE14806.1 hypothetical protein KTT_46650 [Tengunoibacter tsumagoiensis]